ncbi:MAG TPA: hypothetical protein VGB04_12320 [Allosphingosinicella sp.]|jgi:hypothetical protein
MIGRKAAVAALVVATVAPFAASSQVNSYATETMSGQRLVAPQGAMEVHVTRDEVPSGPIPMHMHFWPRYVFVESGEVQVTLLDGGAMQTFTKGQTIVEPLEKWHSGVVVTKKAVLISVEQTPPGGCNTIYPFVPPQPAAPGKPAVPGKPNDVCPRP